MTRDKEKFLKILDANQGIIFKVCSTYCHDPEDQKDLVQNIIIQLWNSFDKYDHQYRITTWIYRIALNVAISFYRKSSTRKKHVRPFEDSFLHIVEEEDQRNEEDLLLLRKFIDELDELNKALIVLYLDGNSHEEIAEILNISTSNVGTKINRIKKKIKIQFKTFENDGIR